MIVDETGKNIEVKQSFVSYRSHKISLAQNFPFSSYIMESIKTTFKKIEHQITFGRFETTIYPGILTITPGVKAVLNSQNKTKLNVTTPEKKSKKK